MRVTNPMTPAAWTSALVGEQPPSAREALRMLDTAAKALLSALPAVATLGASDFTAAPSSGGPVLNPQAELPPTAQATGVSQTEAPSGGVASRILERAAAENHSINPMEAGVDGHYKGWQHLQTVFEKTTGWRPPDAECQKITPGRGVLPGGKNWCGIWATHVLQEAGVNVKWDLNKGKMVGDVTHVIAPGFTHYQQYKMERAAFEQSIRPGDVITLKGSTNHHAIVTKVNPDGTVETMDGNKPHVGPGKTTLADVTTYYRPKES
jgi:hypothetical protein